MDDEGYFDEDDLIREQMEEEFPSPPPSPAERDFDKGFQEGEEEYNGPPIPDDLEDELREQVVADSALQSESAVRAGEAHARNEELEDTLDSKPMKESDLFSFER